MASDKILHINDSNFETEVLQSELPVLIDFSATWCGPCKVVAPIVDQLADEYDGRVKVAKIDVDECPSIAQQYGIRGVPTLLVIKDGKRVDQLVGAVPKAQITALIERAT